MTANAASREIPLENNRFLLMSFLLVKPDALFFHKRTEAENLKEIEDPCRKLQGISYVYVSLFRLLVIIAELAGIRLASLFPSRPFPILNHSSVI